MGSDGGPGQWAASPPDSSRSRRRDDVRWKRTRGIAIVAIFLVFVVLVSVFYYPIWTGVPVTPEFRQLHFWAPSWAT